MPRSLSERLAREERRTKKGGKLDWLRRVEVLDFLETLEIRNVSYSSADEVQYSCPFDGHTHGDDSPSASMNDGSKDPTRATMFHCFGCKRTGTAIDFLAEHENISKQEARIRLKQYYASGFRQPKGGSIAREFEERQKLYTRPLPRLQPALGVEQRQAFDVDWEAFSVGYEDHEDVKYLFNRGFDARTLTQWGIGYDTLSDRFTIPIHDHVNHLVGFKGRAWRSDARPKYRVLGNKPGREDRYDFDTYDKSLVVFGLARCKAQGIKRAIYCEGELDAISLWSVGYPAVSTGSADLSETQALLIRKQFDEVVLFFDDDSAGVKAIWGYTKYDGEHKPGIIDKLGPFLRLRKVGSHQDDPNGLVAKGQQKEISRLIERAKPTWRLQDPQTAL